MTSVQAEVKNVHVFFLSQSKNTSQIDLDSLFKRLNRRPQFSFLADSSLMDDPKCEPYGDGCFHPQYGLITDQSKVMEAKTRKEEEIEEKFEGKTINSQEVDLVNCDDDYFFDIYCGKAKEEKRIAQYEVWIDISASMKPVDFSKDLSYCDRRRIAAKLLDTCKGVDIYKFNTSKEPLGNLENSCLNHGTNNSEKMVQWLKDSDAKNVVIITDADEYNGAFREYLDLINAKIEGIGVDPLTSDKLYEKLDSLKTYCGS